MSYENNPDYNLIGSGTEGQYFVHRDGQTGVKIYHSNFIIGDKNRGIQEYEKHVQIYEWIGSLTAKPLFVEFLDNGYCAIHMEHIEARQSDSQDYNLIAPLFSKLSEILDLKDRSVVSNNNLIDDSGNVRFIDWGYGGFEICD